MMKRKSNALENATHDCPAMFIWKQQQSYRSGDAKRHAGYPRYVEKVCKNEIPGAKSVIFR